MHPLSTLVNRPPAPGTARGLLTLALALALSPLAWADRNTMPARVLPAYPQECASCHTAYAPGMLPRQSWSRIMGGLDKHYGTDASLDEATVRQIAVWLDAHAGTYKRTGAEAPPQDRITRSAWFERKHRPLDAPVWKLPSVKSPANCTACHSRADEGDYGDHSLRMPAGLPASYHRYWQDD
jgi:mono/diheme cytochrome c family protein